MLDPLRKRIIEGITSSAKIIDKHRHVYIQLCEEMFPMKWLHSLLAHEVEHF